MEFCLVEMLFGFLGRNIRSVWLLGNGGGKKKIALNLMFLGMIILCSGYVIRVLRSKILCYLLAFFMDNSGFLD